VKKTTKTTIEVDSDELLEQRFPTGLFPRTATNIIVWKKYGTGRRIWNTAVLTPLYAFATYELWADYWWASVFFGIWTFTCFWYGATGRKRAFL